MNGDLVVNWHVTEACNYRCGYCYAQWDRPEAREVIRDLAATERLLVEIHEAFRTQHGNLRLNFAGGEPLLFANPVLAAMRIARRMGFDVSLISNGSRWTPTLLEEMVPTLAVLGLSLDAGDDAINRAIGRVDPRGKALSVDELSAMIALARSLHPRLVVKVNTVVNAVNWHADLSSLIERLAPDQWKVLRMLPSTSRNLEITQQQFEAFLDRHARFRSLMRVEDNDDMVSSYVMVDPHGRFFQNGQQEFGYAYSPPIAQVGATAAFQAITWSAEKFAARYQGIR